MQEYSAAPVPTGLLFLQKLFYTYHQYMYMSNQILAYNKHYKNYYNY